MNCADVLSAYNILDMILSIADITIILYFFFIRPRRKKIVAKPFKKLHHKKNNKFSRIRNVKANKTPSLQNNQT